MDDENAVGKDGRGAEAVVRGELGPLAFPDELARVIERDRLGAFARAPYGVDAIAIGDGGRGGEVVKIVEVVCLDGGFPAPFAGPCCGVESLQPSIGPIGGGESEKEIFPPEHRRGMPHALERGRPGVVALFELVAQPRHLPDTGPVFPAKARPFLSLCLRKQKKSGGEE